MDYDEIAVITEGNEGLEGNELPGEREAAEAGAGKRALERSPLSKTRSLSDGGGTPKLSPSPHIFAASRTQSKDDSTIRDGDRDTLALPVTPRRPDFTLRGLGLQVPPRELSTPSQPSQSKPGPLSPKLDHSQTYASPTNILPRRSRGLDFSRAATSLHHSILADQASPDSSPTIGSRAMNIPNSKRRSADYGNAEQTSSSLWSMMGNPERMSGSLGSANIMLSDTSTSSEEDDYMDEDMDETFATTPQVTKSIATPRADPSSSGSGPSGTPWVPASPVVNLLSFQQRQRPRKPPRKRLRGPLGLGFNSTPPTGLSRSPPSNMSMTKDISSPHSRRESISWAANQLHISGSESDDNLKQQADSNTSDAMLMTPSRDGQRSVIRKVVTRRGNLLPKTKGFARIRAALAEESAPVETEFRREAEVVRQVRESDMDLEPRFPFPQPVSAATTALSSPNLMTQDSVDEIPEDAMMMDVSGGSSGLGLSSSFKQQALRNSKGKVFWDTFSESSSIGAPHTTPPPPSFLPRGSSSGISLEDVGMDSPSNTSSSTTTNPFAAAMAIATGLPVGISLANLPPTTTSSSGHETPLPGASQGSGSASVNNNNNNNSNNANAAPPTAAEITRRINSKRRRGDDDFDPASFKRRAVSPGMSVHNSPIMQSPLQRDMAPWGSRPGSNGGDSRPAGGASGSSAPSENGSQGGGQGNSGNAGGGGSSGGSGTGASGRVNGKGRVGYQGMVDTNDGITRLSIE